MPITLYTNYIDYNGNRTFVNVSNIYPVSDCGDFQCQVSFQGLQDNGETVTFNTSYYRYNCNCACNC
jgi:hypothetical protein